jgi:hypothetical protein
MKTKLIWMGMISFFPSLKVSIDVTKYATQMTVRQDEPPCFDPQNGLVRKSGTLKVNIQSSMLPG